MVDEKRVKEVAKLLLSYSNPYITEIEIKEEKVYDLQTSTEPCVVCFVYRSYEELEERCMDHNSPFPYQLIFPEYYLTSSDEEILKDVEERKADYKNFIIKKRKNKYNDNKEKLDIDISLSKISKQEYYDLVELVKNSNLSDKIKKSFDYDNWTKEYNNLVQSFNSHNHFDGPFK